MGLSCGFEAEGYVEVLEEARVSEGTIVCRECTRLVYPGTEYTVVRSYVIDDDGGEVETGKTAVCERCGGAIESYLALGYCYAPGDLRYMVADMRDELFEERK